MNKDVATWLRNYSPISDMIDDGWVEYADPFSFLTDGTLRTDVEYTVYKRDSFAGE